VATHPRAIGRPVRRRRLVLPEAGSRGDDGPASSSVGAAAGDDAALPCESGTIACWARHRSIWFGSVCEPPRPGCAGVSQVSLVPCSTQSEPFALDSELGDDIAQTGRAVAVAESLTGGLLSARLARLPQASMWFRGGVVAYMAAASTAS
jgi:Competence-damaged protein